MEQAQLDRFELLLVRLVEATEHNTEANIQALKFIETRTLPNFRQCTWRRSQLWRRKIYLAGGSTEAAIVSRYGRWLEAEGFERTHDWTPQVLQAQADGKTDRDLDQHIRLEAALLDTQAVISCHTLWLLMPMISSFGAGVEFGYALADKARTRYIVASGRCSSIFTELADVCFPSHQEAFDHLVQRIRSK